jgi:hypothetical protein
MDWKELIEKEPRLVNLLTEAENQDQDAANGYCAGVRYCNKINPQLYRLVGFDCDNPELQTMDAWQCATKTLWNALPMCLTKDGERICNW